MVRPKELMIYVRGRWEIAHVQKNSFGVTGWYRRDQSWICDETGKNEIEATMPLPPAPAPETTGALRNLLRLFEEIDCGENDDAPELVAARAALSKVT